MEEIYNIMMKKYSEKQSRLICDIIVLEVILQHRSTTGRNRNAMIRYRKENGYDFYIASFSRDDLLSLIEYDHDKYYNDSDINIINNRLLIFKNDNIDLLN